MRHFGGEPREELAGVFILDVGGVPFEGYCIELGTSAWVYSEYDAVLEPVSTINGGLQAGFLYDEFAPDVEHDYHAAALQLAMWEVVEDWDSDPDLSSGNLFVVTASAEVITAAETYLAAIPAVITEPPQAVILHHDEYQDILVPEPVLWPLLAAALGLLPARKRR